MSHPPSAERVVAIDFDATIAPWGPLFDLEAPFEGVKEAVTRLSDSGFKVIILTSRLSPTWWASDYARFGYAVKGAFAMANRRYVEEYLWNWGIPFDLVTCEKVPAEVYFDDRAIEVPCGTLAAQIHSYLREAYPNEAD